jgi:hypothetical protein
MVCYDNRPPPNDGLVGPHSQNAAGHRLDTILPLPREAQWEAFHIRKNDCKICNTFHFRNGCNDTACKFDHSPITPDIRCVLAFMLKEWPCRQGGDCRRSGCLYGYVYQKKACALAKSLRCKYRRAGHSVDTRVDKRVQPNEMDDGMGSSAETSSSADTMVCRAQPVTASALVSQAPKKENANINCLRNESRKGSMENCRAISESLSTSESADIVCIQSGSSIGLSYTVPNLSCGQTFVS